MDFISFWSVLINDMHEQCKQLQAHFEEQVQMLKLNPDDPAIASFKDQIVKGALQYGIRLELTPIMVEGLLGELTGDMEAGNSDAI